MLFACVAATGAAAAGAARGMASAAQPGAVHRIDRRIDAFTTHALLAQPASRLLDTHRQRVAGYLHRASQPLFFGWAFSQIVVLTGLWFFGLAARTRDTLARYVRNAFVRRTLVATLAMYAAQLGALPIAFVRFRLDLAFGASTEAVAAWLRDYALAASIEALVVGLVVAAIFELVDRTRLWYLYAIAGLMGVSLAAAFFEPVLFAPLYNHFVPLAADAPIRAPLDRLAARAGIVDAPIYRADFSRRNQAVVADIAGFGPTKRIVLGDALLADATPDEILFLAAREFGHYRHGDDFRLSLVWAFLFICTTALAVIAADRVPFRRDDDSLARIPLVLAFIGLLGLLVWPLYNGYSRNLESQADVYALQLTHSRAAAVRAFVRIGDDTLAVECPPRATRLYFLNVPPIGTRIARAQRAHNPCK